MKKIVPCALIALIVLTLFNPAALAASKNGIEYSGESYYAVVREGVIMRDASGNKIKYLDAGTPVRVEGRLCDDKSRVAVTDKAGDFGTVIKRGLKKVTATSQTSQSSKITYSGSSYKAEVKKYLNVRDANYNIVGQITQGTQVDVKGKSDQWADRSVIPYDCSGGLATVLTSGLRKVHASSKSDNASTGQENAYWAATTRSTPLRSKDGSIVCNIPRAAWIKVLQVNGKDKSVLDVIYDDKSGCVPAKSVKRVKDGVFVDIDRQKVTLIRKGKIILTSKCVTGTLNKKDTPKGIFKIGEKRKNKVFHPSEKESLFWGRIGNTRCGFHDARWRRNWSSSCYKTSGSDGCVNMPLSSMEKFYKNVYVGLYVYIY